MYSTLAGPAVVTLGLQKEAIAAIAGELEQEELRELLAQVGEIARGMDEAARIVRSSGEDRQGSN